MLKIYSIFFVLFSWGIESLAYGSDLPKQLAEFAQSSAWLNLLYYEGKKDHYKSIIADDKFFVDKRAGRTDPLAELTATVDLFAQDRPESDEHPQCVFPARYKLLQNVFKLKPAMRCPRLNEWQESYAPRDLVLVYASQYISNPASVFGHSFLLVSSDRQTKGFWLTYNYAASIPEDTSGFGYVYGGLTGWFVGDYSVMPFYHRLSQYGSVENRDLWLYKVKLSHEELDLFLRHMWELVHTARFTYYFMTENCAGVLMRTFAAVLPDMHEANRLSIFYVLPIDVVKALDKAGRIQDVDLAPSEGNVLRADVAALSSDQYKRFRMALQNPNSDLTDVDAKVSETLIQYTSYMKRKNKDVLKPELKMLERNAYIRRAQFRDSPMVYSKTAALSEAPHLSHDPSMLQVGGSWVNQLGAVDLTYRFAIHDILDPDAGFLKNSAIEFGKVMVSATHDQVWLREFTAIKMETFQPFLRIDPLPSWRAQAVVKENLLAVNPNDLFAQAQGGYGAGVSWGDHFVYALLEGDLNFGVNLPQKTLEAGPLLGAIFKWHQAKAYTNIGAGSGFFQGADGAYLRINSGVRWALTRQLSLIQENEWTRLMQLEIEGYRVSLGLRYYY